jgi:hypothetical protein
MAIWCILPVSVCFSKKNLATLLWKRYICRYTTGFWKLSARKSFSVFPFLKQGCQIYLDSTYQNGENIPNDHKICPMAVNYTK